MDILIEYEYFLITKIINNEYIHTINFNLYDSIIPEDAYNIICTCTGADLGFIKWGG